MRRYWLTPKFIDSDTIEISGDVFHHIFDVCRQGEGSTFEVLLGDQKAHVVKVTSVEKKKAFAKILESRALPVPQKPLIHLCLSVSRFQVMDAVVEKAVEMGVAEIHPFYSEFSFIRKSLPEAKFARWEKIIISATQQSGRGDLMKIHEACELSKLLSSINQSPKNLGLFAYEGDTNLSVKEYISDKYSKDLENIWLFVGSEGGFSTSEVQDFRQGGLEPVSLGEQVLRVETACISLVSILKYEFVR